MDSEWRGGVMGIQSVFASWRTRNGWTLDRIRPLECHFDMHMHRRILHSSTHLRHRSLSEVIGFCGCWNLWLWDFQII
jgi:hypothetical protein